MADVNEEFEEKLESGKIEGVVVCASFEGFWQLSDPDFMPGSTVIDCACGHKGLISPEGLMFLHNDPRRIVSLCFYCWDKRDRAGKDTGKAQWLPGGRDVAEGLVADNKVPANALREMRKRFGLS